MNAFLHITVRWRLFRSQSINQIYTLSYIIACHKLSLFVDHCLREYKFSHVLCDFLHSNDEAQLAVIWDRLQSACYCRSCNGYCCCYYRCCCCVKLNSKWLVFFLFSSIRQQIPQNLNGPQMVFTSWQPQLRQGSKLAMGKKVCFD